MGGCGDRRGFTARPPPTRTGIDVEYDPLPRRRSVRAKGSPRRTHFADRCGRSPPTILFRRRLRFPLDFMLQLSAEENRNLKFQSGTSSWGGTRKPPRAFTEQGGAMMSSVLRSARREGCDRYRRPCPRTRPARSSGEFAADNSRHDSPVQQTEPIAARRSPTAFPPTITPRGGAEGFALVPFLAAISRRRACRQGFLRAPPAKRIKRQAREACTRWPRGAPHAPASVRS